MNSSIPFTCDLTVNPIFEVSKYIFTVLYLGIGGYLHLSIILTTVGSRKTKFGGGSSFFQIFATDSIASIFLILSELLFNRFFMYISPLCPLVSQFFFEPSVIQKVFYQVTHHARFAKSVAQIFMVSNRMSCVLMPMDYGRFWRKLTPVCVFLVVMLPWCGTWNILISRTYGQSIYGGFATNYIRAVQWAALSMFQSIYIITALIITVICTLITLIKLISIPERIKAAERSLCLASFGISVTFLLVGGTQMCFASTECRKWQGLYITQLLAFDVFTIGSAVIMIMTNYQLRDAIFKREKTRNSVKVVTVQSIS